MNEQNLTAALLAHPEGFIVHPVTYKAPRVITDGAIKALLAQPPGEPPYRQLGTPHVRQWQAGVLVDRDLDGLPRRLVRAREGGLIVALHLQLEALDGCVNAKVQEDGSRGCAVLGPARGVEARMQALERLARTMRGDLDDRPRRDASERGERGAREVGGEAADEELRRVKRDIIERAEACDVEVCDGVRGLLGGCWGGRGVRGCLDVSGNAAHGGEFEGGRQEAERREEESRMVAP